MERRPPYGSYAVIMGVFAAGLAGAGALARRFDRNPACQTALDLGVLSLASFKAARTLSNDEVTSFLRQPFVKGQAHEGEDEEPVEGGMEQAIGELVTCSRCVGTWAAAGANDFLQAAFVALSSKANELEEREEDSASPERSANARTHVAAA